jgi:hypothetical protein
MARAYKRGQCACQRRGLRLGAGSHPRSHPNGMARYSNCLCRTSSCDKSTPTWCFDRLAVLGSSLERIGFARFIKKEPDTSAIRVSGKRYRMDSRWRNERFRLSMRTSSPTTR